MAGENPARPNSSSSIARIVTRSNKRSILFCPARKDCSAASANPGRKIAQSGCQRRSARGTTPTASGARRAWLNKYCNNSDVKSGASTANIKLSSVGELRNAAWIPPKGPQPGNISSTTGANAANFLWLPTMRTSGVTDRARPSALAKSVRPSNSTKALSLPMRVLLPPARTNAVGLRKRPLSIPRSYTSGRPTPQPKCLHQHSLSLRHSSD